MCETCQILREQLVFLQSHIKDLTENSQATINGLLVNNRASTPQLPSGNLVPLNEDLDRIYKAIASEGYPIGSQEYRHTVQWAETQLAAGVGLAEILLGIKEGGNGDYDIDDNELLDDEDIE